MTREGKDTFEDLFAELYQDPAFREEYRRQKPYYDILLQVVKRRKALGLTQKDVATRAGTHQSSVSRIESGEYDIRLSTLVQVAEALDTSVDIHLVPIFDLEEDEYIQLCEIPLDYSPVQELLSAPTIQLERVQV